MIRFVQAVSACGVFTLVVALAASGCGSRRYPGKVKAGTDAPNASCESSEKCKVWGWCGDVNGECAPTSDEHCRSSALCKKSGLCHFAAADGHDAARCIAKGDDCDDTEWCRKYSLCDADEGVCK